MTTLTEPLTKQEMHRLTLFKWRYQLTAAGFTPAQAARLSFWRWSWLTGRVVA